jgi:ribokinase
MVRQPDQTVVVTLGAAGAVAVGPGGCDVIAGLPVSAVDTTGAGDCFLGVMAASLAAGVPLPDALRRANRAAAQSVTQPGAGGAQSANSTQ